MPKYIVKFGIGGVQAFIAQARKMRDFAAGSELIQKIARQLARNVINQRGTLVSPPEIPAEGVPFPQQFTISISKSDSDELSKWCDEIVNITRMEWRSTLVEALETRLEIRPGTRLANAVYAQIDGALELSWVATISGGVPRKTANELAEAYDDRRRTRTYVRAVTVGQEWPATCTVCGLREAVPQPKKENEEKDDTFLTNGECLCALCTARRVWSREVLQHIPSTHRFAWHRLYWDRRFERFRARHVLKVLDEMLDNWGPLNSGWPSGLRTGTKPKQKKKSPQQTATNSPSATSPSSQVLKAFSALRDDSTAFTALQELSSYYAIVTIDGDSIGEWLSGKHLRDDNDFAAAQAQLSRALLRFSRDLPTALWPFTTLHAVHAAYFGGDDVLLFSSLDALFPLIREVQRTWNLTINGTREFSEKGDTPTISLHASIIHAKKPLQPALAEAFERLGKAKSRADRNCVSLLCDVQNGVQVQFISAWDELRQLENAIATCGRSSLSSPEPGVSARVLHSLEVAMGPFFTGDHLQLGVTSKAFRLELLRILKRSCSGEFEALALVDWLEYRANTRQGDVFGWERFQSALRTVAFLSRQFRLNEGS